MKYLFFLLFITAIAYGRSEDIKGFWKTEKGKAIFKVYKVGDEYKGDIVWMDSAYVDLKNPDETLRGKPVLGSRALKKMIYNEKKDKWENGKIYDAKSGKTYSCEATVSKDKRVLYLRGYAGISIIGRTTTWTRVEEGSFVLNSADNGVKD